MRVCSVNVCGMNPRERVNELVVFASEELSGLREDRHVGRHVPSSVHSLGVGVLGGAEECLFRCTVPTSASQSRPGKTLSAL